jgi:hypothetical protein
MELSKGQVRPHPTRCTSHPFAHTPPFPISSSTARHGVFSSLAGHRDRMITRGNTLAQDSPTPSDQRQKSRPSNPHSNTPSPPCSPHPTFLPSPPGITSYSDACQDLSVRTSTIIRQGARVHGAARRPRRRRARESAAASAPAGSFRAVAVANAQRRVRITGA